MQVLRRPDGPLQDTYPVPRAITIEDLMTHRSGLAYSFTARGPLAQALEQRFGLEIDSARTPDEWMKTLASLPLSYAPGRALPLQLRHGSARRHRRPRDGLGYAGGDAATAVRALEAWSTPIFGFHRKSAIAPRFSTARPRSAISCGLICRASRIRCRPPSAPVDKGWSRRRMTIWSSRACCSRAERSGVHACFPRHRCDQ